MAEDHAGSTRLVRQSQKGQLLYRAIPPLAGPLRAKKAICAVAAAMLTAIYHMLKNGAVHQDLGAGYFDRRSTAVKANRLVTQLATLGYQVEL